MENNQTQNNEAEILEEPIEEEVKDSITYISLEKLVPNKEQCTEIRNQEKFDKLVKDIRRYGLNQPILVRPIGDEKYEVVAGYNRWKALEKLGGRKRIEAKVVEMSDDESAERCLSDNLHHQELTPYHLEMAIYKRYTKFKCRCNFSRQ